MVLAEAVRHVFRMEREGGHTHVEPGSRSGDDLTQQHALDVAGMKHRAHVG